MLMRAAVAQRRINKMKRTKAKWNYSKKDRHGALGKPHRRSSLYPPSSSFPAGVLATWDVELWRVNLALTVKWRPRRLAVYLSLVSRCNEQPARLSIEEWGDRECFLDTAAAESALPGPPFIIRPSSPSALNERVQIRFEKGTAGKAVVFEGESREFRDVVFEDRVDGWGEKGEGERPSWS